MESRKQAKCKQCKERGQTEKRGVCITTTIDITRKKNRTERPKRMHGCSYKTDIPSQRRGCIAGRLERLQGQRLAGDTKIAAEAWMKGGLALECIPVYTALSNSLV